MINFVIAHHTEAAPLISHYQLKKVNTKQPFPLFASPEHRLIISGMGKSNSAAATAWLASFENLNPTAADAVWVNFGIAGHPDQSIGTMRCANKITEQTTGSVWFPVQLKSTISSCQILTTDTICHQYQPDCLHEMEASGFYRTALRFTTAELAQCLKIVSDNVEHPADKIDLKHIGHLIADQLANIGQYISALNTLSKDSQPIATSDAEDQFVKRWKFTVTQSRQLQRLLQRYSVLLGDPETVLTINTFPSSVNSASKALDTLRDILARTENTL